MKFLYRPGEAADDGQECVDAESVVAVDELDGGHLPSDRPGPDSTGPWVGKRGQELVQLANAAADFVVVALRQDSRAAMTMEVMTNVSHPPRANFSIEVMTRIVRHTTRPIRWMGRYLFHFGSLRPVLDEKAGHPELGQGERQKDVDRIHDHQGRDVAVRIQEEQDGRAAHEQDAVLNGETTRERGEPVWKPVIHGHVGHDPGPVDKTRLGRDEQEGALRRKS